MKFFSQIYIQVVHKKPKGLILGSIRLSPLGGQTNGNKSNTIHLQKAHRADMIIENINVIYL